MSYDEFDAARDEMYTRLSEELYPEHKEQAVAEFANDRLRSYYLDNPRVAFPAVKMMREAEALLLADHFDAALVFAASSTEIFLKATLLRPVIHGLVHSVAIADVVVETTLAQPGLDRYEKLLSYLFEHLTGEKLNGVSRKDVNSSLLKEIHDIRLIRNGIVHRGDATTKTDAERALHICQTTAISILNPVLLALGLEARKGEGIQPIRKV
jgi:hypothetical protein